MVNPIVVRKAHKETWEKSEDDDNIIEAPARTSKKTVIPESISSNPNDEKGQMSPPFSWVTDASWGPHRTTDTATIPSQTASSPADSTSKPSGANDGTQTASPTAIGITTASSWGIPSPTATNSETQTTAAPYLQKDQSPPKVIYAAAAIVPIVIIVLFVALFFYLRNRKRRQMQNAHVQQMEQTRGATVQPHFARPVAPRSPPPPSMSPPPMALAMAPPVAGPTLPQPVILGPIEQNSSGTYYTGIDTSDVVSMNDNDRTGLGNPFADHDEPDEEPPPPYRPRSVAPLSRDTSLRAPPANHSRSNLLDGSDQPRESPFADPQDDDAVSDMSRPSRRNQDEMSVVSDMSYQEDPVVVRPTL